MSPPVWPLWAEQTSSAGWLEMPSLGAQLSYQWKLSHLLFLSSTEFIPSRGAPWDDATQSPSDHRTNVSAIRFPKCLPQRKRAINSQHQNPALSQISTCPTIWALPYPGHLFKATVYKASPTVFYASSKSTCLWCMFCPVPGTYTVRLAEPKRGTALNCPEPWACFSAWVHVSVQLLMEGYSDSSKATVEREQNSINMNSGQEPGLQVQGSILRS